MRTRNLPAPVAGMLLGPTVPVDWNDGMPMENWLVSGREVTWMLREPETGRENMDVTWTFAAATSSRCACSTTRRRRTRWRIRSTSTASAFSSCRATAWRTSNLVWKDTAIVAAGETVDMLLELSNPGRWMLHCHIAEHLGTGMMTVFEVRPSDAL